MLIIGAGYFIDELFIDGKNKINKYILVLSFRNEKTKQLQSKYRFIIN